MFDDWTHELTQQLAAFGALFPHLTTGGVYFVAVRSLVCLVVRRRRLIVGSLQGLNVGYEKGRATSSSWIEETKNMLVLCSQCCFASIL